MPGPGCAVMYKFLSTRAPVQHPCDTIVPLDGNEDIVRERKAAGTQPANITLALRAVTQSCGLPPKLVNCSDTRSMKKPMMNNILTPQTTESVAL